MKRSPWRQWPALAGLAVLLLAACQQPTTVAPELPAVTPGQPAGAVTEAAAPVEITAAVTQAAPSASMEPGPAVTPAAPAASMEPGPAVTNAAPTAGAELPGTGLEVPPGWQAVAGESLGYSLAVPPVWESCQETKYSRSFCQSEAEAGWMGLPLRLYVSVYPQDSDNADFEVYNFLPLATIQGFQALAVGESMLREPASPTPDYFTYTRLPDRMVAGRPALVIENSRVWEMPAGTKERVVLLVDGGKVAMLGMYYQTPEQLALFEQVLDSFRLEG